MHHRNPALILFSLCYGGYNQSYQHWSIRFLFLEGRARHYLIKGLDCVSWCGGNVFHLCCNIGRYQSFKPEVRLDARPAERFALLPFSWGLMTACSLSRLSCILESPMVQKLWWIAGYSFERQSKMCAVQPIETSLPGFSHAWERVCVFYLLGRSRSSS